MQQRDAPKGAAKQHASGRAGALQLEKLQRSPNLLSKQDKQVDSTAAMMCPLLIPAAAAGLSLPTLVTTIKPPSPSLRYKPVEPELFVSVLASTVVL